MYDSINRTSTKGRTTKMENKSMTDCQELWWGGDYKRAWGSSWGAGIVLHLNYGGNYTSVYGCQNSKDYI